MSTEKQRTANARNFWADANPAPAPAKKATAKQSSATSSTAAKPTTSSSPKSTHKKSASTSNPTPSKPTTTTTSPAKPQTSTASPATQKTTTTPSNASQAPAEEAKKPGFFSTFTSKVRSMTTFTRSDSQSGSSSSSSSSSGSSGEKQLQISAPQGVVHSGHVGFSSNGLQLSGSSVPPELRLLMARLDQKLTSMGATQLTPEEQDAVLRRMVAGPRNTAKPGALTLPTTVSPTTATPATGTPKTVPTITLPTTTSDSANQVSTPLRTRGPATNAINTESLKMLTVLLKERDDRIRELEAEVRLAKSAQIQSPIADSTKFAEEKRILLQQKRELEQQISQLKDRSNTTPRASIAPNEISKLVEERVKIIQAQSAREIDALKVRVTALEKERDELIDTKAKLEVELSRAKTAPNRIASVGLAGINSQASADLKRVEAELAEVRTRLKSAESQRETAESGKRMLQSQVDTLQSQLSAKDVKSSEAEAALFQAKLNELSTSHAKALETLRGETQTQREHIVKLQQQLRDSELASQSAKAAQSNSSGELNSFKEAMQKELDSARSESAQLDKAKAALEKAKDALQAKLEEVTAALGAEKEKSARETESQSKLSKRIGELENTLNARTKEHQASLDTVKASLALAEKETSAAKSEVSSLKSQLDSLSSDGLSSSTELEALEDQLQAALAEAKQAQARLATANSDKERTLKSHSDLEAKIRQLSEELQAAKTQQNESAQSADLAAEVVALEKEVQKERNSKNRLEDEKDALETTLAQMKATLSDSSEAQARSESQLKEARKELDVLRAQLSSLEDSMSAPPPPPVPIAPTPPSSSPSLTPSRSVPDMNKSLLDSIKNPDVVLKRTSQMLKLPSDVTDGDDILSALARRIIDRRGRMKGGSALEDDDELDGDW